MLRTTLVVALLAAGLVLAGCHAPAPEDPPRFTFEATDYAFTGPSELPAGWVELVLEHRGMAPHHIQLYRLTEGRDMADLLAHFQEAHGPPAWAIPMGGPNPPNPGESSSAFVHLEPGEYAMLCMIPDSEGTPHFALGMVHEVKVVDQDNRAQPPEATLAVGLHDYSFQAGPWTAGDHIVDGVNEGGEPHEIVLVRYHEGANFSHLLAAFSPEATGPPPADFLGGFSAIAPGDRQSFPVTLTPGRYGLICFIEHAETGAPHFAMGMVDEITVT